MIGEYPTVSLQDARVARDDARELVKKGLHPSHARQEVLLTCLISSGHFNLWEWPRLLQLNNTAA
ncbi:hypothetical protein BamMEX5DRAFT_4200 [Burkholderia ambifaria MEX-5]|uniref:Integrase DNA-binding domain-containing protein n=1 Tax=Burkholderia ambifaria MEX-5 TaxID=396597 RepID=B1T8T4_9BURK|nr:Arm DNA-binding domain-containing protein [Burkholderia ambifaria]EDT40020.1 hypothetical protein BamMEX5DRAFT_4200 [Burkholderia ambifaria MEX-5]